MDNSHAEQFLMSMKDTKGPLGWLEYNISKLTAALQTQDSCLHVEYEAFNMLTSLLCAIEWYEAEYNGGKKLDCEERKTLTTIFDTLKHFQLTRTSHDKIINKKFVTSMHIDENVNRHYTPVVCDKEQGQQQPKSWLSIAEQWHKKLKVKLDGI